MTRACRLPLASIRLDGGTQPRAFLDAEAIEAYAQDLLDGAMFPPVEVFHDGRHYWLADGFHRFHGHARAGLAEALAIVRQGTRRDAVLWSCQANAQHGMRRSDADKARAVMTLLGDPEWGRWSNMEIARRCLVSEGLVRSLRAGDTSDETKYRLFTHPKTGEPAAMGVANIGRTGRAAESAVIAALELVRRQHLRLPEPGEAAAAAGTFPPAEASAIAQWWVAFQNALPGAQDAPKTREMAKEVVG